MKKWLGIVVMSLLFLGQINAQDVVLPNEVLQTFNQKFEGADNINWSKKNQYYKVDFGHQREEKSAWIGQTGDLEMVQTQIGKDELPGPVCTTLNDDGFANHKFKKVYKLEMQHEVMYKLDARNSGGVVEILVREDGKIVDQSDENLSM